MSSVEGGGNIISRDLLLYFDGANSKSYVNSSTTLNNLIFNEIGTLDNGVGFTTSNNGYFTFDGTDDKISFGTRISSLNLTYPFSVDVWINVDPTGNTTTFRGIFSTSNVPSLSAYYGVTVQLASAYNGSGNYKVSIGVGNGVSAGTTGRRTLITNDEVLIGGNWCHLVCTYDVGPTFKIYVNGIEKSGTLSGTGGALVWGTNTLTEIARTSGGYNNLLVGGISNLKFYNTLLSPAEILQNYNATKSRFGL